MIEIVEIQNGYYYLLNGVWHRPNYPAYVTNSYTSWYLFDDKHRYYGPAAIWKQSNEWYIRGRRLK